MGRPAIVTPATGLAAGVVAGVVGVAVLAGLGWPSGDEDPAGGESAAATAFVDAWRRSRLATWVVDGRFERRVGDRVVLAVDVHRAQRPPDRLSVGFGAVDARAGGRRLACAEDDAGVVTCRDGGPAPPYAEEVDDEIELLRRYVAPDGLYTVAAEPGGCFRLRLRRAMLTPPYGQRARFCFDPETGAPVRAELERLEATDRTVAVRVDAHPTDEDLVVDGVRDGGGRG
jgi:hypothetical protein